MSRVLRIAAVLTVVTLLLSACYPYQGTTVRTSTGPDLVGSRKLIEKTFDLSGFNAVDVRNGASAQIAQGATPAVKVTVDDNAAEFLDVRIVDGRLVIGLKPGSYRNVTLRAAITMPELTAVTASGGSRVNFEPFTTTSTATFNSNGGATITGSIESGDASVTASGGADVTLAGKGGNLLLNHSGGGKVNLGDFAVNDASVLVTGGSNSEINASGNVTGSVSGGGQLKVVGPATVNVSANGGGRVLR